MEFIAIAIAAVICTWLIVDKGIDININKTITTIKPPEPPQPKLTAEEQKAIEDAMRESGAGMIDKVLKDLNGFMNAEVDDHGSQK